MLSPGARIGSYEIAASLGAGGMGEVYRARDTKLGRDVALKILPDPFASDADRLARFEREARTLAALNHPHIAQIYGVEESSDSRALVMELVEGEDLSARLWRGRIPIDEALPIARQITEALAAAHDHGVIHRDLKPANIKVRPDGTVKVLDFGLAKAFDRSPGAEGAHTASVANSPTMTTPGMTQAGVILGTAAYMSPEQARGKPVDKRADIWAFGCVLYEMLTGSRAFGGEEVSDTFVAILRDSVDLGRLPPETPPALRLAIVACLQRDPAQRIHDMGDLQLLMAGAFQPLTSDARGAATAGLRWRQPPALVASLAVLTLAGLAVVGWRWSRPVPVPARSLIQLALPLQVGDSLDIERGVPVRPAISPDGRLFVYASRRDGLARLYRRGLDQLTATPIPGTEGAAFPFFSPDGQWIGFWADAAMKKVAVAGGAPIVVTSARTQSAGTWGDDDSIVFAEFTTGGGVLRVPAAGGNAQAVTRLAPSQTDNNHVAPHVLPGGRVVLYSVHSSAKMMAITLATGTQKEVTEGYWPQYLRSGHLVFVRGTSLWAVPFDPKRVELTGTAVRLLDGVIAGPAIGRDGTLVYLSGVPGGVQLVWVDRQGREEPVDLPPAAIQDVALSRGGRQLATSHGVWPEPLGIWIYDIARKTSSKLTTERGLSVFPLWSPDGAQVLYGSTFAGPRNVYRRSADGAGQAVRLTKLDIQHSPWGWSKDGRTLVIQLLRPQTSWDVASVPADGGDATMLVETPGLDLEAAVSPDGRWIAYSSNASGTYQIFVRPFPKVNETSWPISTAGGREARWSRDGRELFYREGQAIMRVPIEAGSTFAPGRPELVLKGNYLTTRGNKAWDVGPDGRFLMMKEVSAQYSVNVVLGWMDDLKARVPVGQ